MMKRLMLAAALAGLTAPALASDLPSRKGPPIAEVIPVFSWTGFYMGGDVGYAFGHNDTSYFVDGGGPFVASGSSHPGGIIGGAHMGYNWQVPPSIFGALDASGLVLGIEGDIQASSYHKTSAVAGPADLPGAQDARAEIFGSVRGRLGYAFNHTLVYATGGVAATNFRTLVVGDGGSDGDWVDKVGYTVGGGIEYAINDHWSIRAEYRFEDYGHYNEYLANSTGGIYDAHHRETVQRVEAGFSYKFNTGALVPVAERN